MLKLEIIIVLYLILLPMGCENRNQSINITNSFKEVTSFNIDIKNNYTISRNLNAYENQPYKIINLLSNIPQEMYENAVYYFENDNNSTDDSAKLFILAQSDNKDILVYGYENLDCGKQGIVVNYKIGEENHYNYFDFNWEPYHRNPSIFIYDYDNDGQKEIALCLQEATGTGINRQQLIMFEILGSGYLDAYKFEYNQQLAEISKSISYKIDIENHIVTLINTTKDKNKILDILFEEIQENISIENIDYFSQLTFDIDDKIIMNIYPGLRIREQASTYYDSFDEHVLRFSITYNYDKSFSLNLMD